jgi:TatD DNase family protein
MKTLLVDSHCQLDFPEFGGREDELLAAMEANGVGWALIAGVTLERFPDVLALTERFPNLYAAVGVHPDSREGEEPDEDKLVCLAAHPKVVAIGETGLDYYRLEGDLEWQRRRFRTHIGAARQCGTPLIIHTREAAADTLRILDEEKAGEVGGVFHCFTESREVAETALGLGFHISFSGIVTFKNACQIKEVARLVPLDRILVETDAPYLAPVPHRGKLNHPALVRHVAEEVAKLKGLALEEFTDRCTQNFARLFGLALNA